MASKNPSCSRRGAGATVSFGRVPFCASPFAHCTAPRRWRLHRPSPMLLLGPALLRLPWQGRPARSSSATYLHVKQAHLRRRHLGPVLCGSAAGVRGPAARPGQGRQARLLSPSRSLLTYPFETRKASGPWPGSTHQGQQGQKGSPRRAVSRAGRPKPNSSGPPPGPWPALPAVPAPQSSGIRRAPVIRSSPLLPQAWRVQKELYLSRSGLDGTQGPPLRHVLCAVLAHD